MVRLPLGSTQDNNIKTYSEARLKHDSHPDAMDDELGEGTMRVTARGISQV